MKLTDVTIRVPCQCRACLCSLIRLERSSSLCARCARPVSQPRRSLQVRMVASANAYEIAPQLQRAMRAIPGVADADVHLELTSHTDHDPPAPRSPSAAKAAYQVIS